MVYFLGDWGMGDSDCASYQHVPQIPSAHINQFHSHHHQQQHHNQQNDDIISLTQELNNQTSISNASSISSSTVTVNLQQLSVSEHRPHQPQQQTPPYIGRQRSESCVANVGAGTSVNNNNLHQQKDFNFESDDEVSLHPLSNQVRIPCCSNILYNVPCVEHGILYRMKHFEFRKKNYFHLFKAKI